MGDDDAALPTAGGERPRPDAAMERATTRYLDLLKAALLDEHYIENELRIQHLVDSLERKRQPEDVKLRDPARYLREEARALRAARRAGRQRTRATASEDHFAYASMGRIRLDHLHACLDTVRTERVVGDLVECGTGRGGGAIFMRGYLAAHELAAPLVWVADPFRAAPVGGDVDYLASLLPDINLVRDGFDHFDLFDDRVRFLQGEFRETLPDAPISDIALLRIGDTVDTHAGDVLDALYDRVAPGGFVLVDNGVDDTVRAAVERFRSARGITDSLVRVDDTATFWRKSSGATKPTPTTLERRPHRAPFPPDLSTDAIDLSVVVVFYNMRREAARTLHSLSRAYQRDVAHVRYEVIAVENGSSEDQKLGDEFVRSFGPEFRYVDLGADACPSPVVALNRGIEVSRGRSFALMIDGAHVLTPGVLRYGLAGLATYAPAIVATQQWYVGPGDQGNAMMGGYDQEYEDGLFTAIQWPVDGYRLFDIGSFIGDRDWFDGMWESNCIFAPRAVLEQVGGFDEGFAMAGGGYANLELYERLGSTPGVSVVTILGEGSFHQLHGGTTTNQTDADERRRRVSSYGEHFLDIRGRRFKGPGKPIHYVGSMTAGSGVQRSKARRRIGDHWFEPRKADAPDGIPQKATPIPDEMKDAYIDAVWHSLAWQRTEWLGRVIAKPPTDLVAYQEIVSRHRPDWILDIGTGTGGRAFFLATICDLVGHGYVVSVDDKHEGELPAHDRITYVTGHSLRPKAYDRIQALIGGSRNVLVILAGRASRYRTDREFERYAPLVPLGSYVIIEDTIVNGHPVWPSFGAGPAESVKNVMNTRGDFAPDPEMERYGLTFNPSGFLKRIS